MNRSKGYLLALATVLAALAWLIVRPFLQYVLAAALIAFMLYPLQRRLETRTSPTVAAFSLLLLAIAGLIVPVALVVVAYAGDAVEILQTVGADSVQIGGIESRIEAATGREVDLVEQLAGSGQEIGMVAFERTTEAFSTLTHLVLGLGVAIFLIYYLLKDGDVLLAWLHRTVPLPGDVQRDLYAEIEGVMWAVLFGNVLVGVIQGVVAGAGLFVTGIPNAGFWTVVMIVLALIPLVGTIPVWLGAVVYLLLTEEPLLAAGLFVYSVVVVGLTDDYLRPFAVDRYAELNPAVILLGVLGGAYAFGIMGVFYGPVIIGALKATLSIVADRWDDLEDAESDVDPRPRRAS